MEIIIELTHHGTVMYKNAMNIVVQDSTIFKNAYVAL